MGDRANTQIVGLEVLDVVGEHLSPSATEKFKSALTRLLSGSSDLEILENEANSRWFRSKMVPLKGKTGANGVEDENHIAGVIVIGSDVTGMRRKEQENITLLANETAAKAASKMKSNFLAVSSLSLQKNRSSPNSLMIYLYRQRRILTEAFRICLTKSGHRSQACLACQNC